MIKVGSRVKFDGERNSYAVQAAGDRYVVMTKPFNARKTYIYTIADLLDGVRGPVGLVFGLPYPIDNPKGASDLLADMKREGWGVSRRREKGLSDGELRQLTAI